MKPSGLGTALALALVVTFSCTDRDTAGLPRLVAHALGGVDGNIYSNSLEAFQQNQAQGCRGFEIDLWVSQDDKLVATHGPRELSLHGLGASFSHREFIGSQHRGRYTPLDGSAIAKLLQQHSDTLLLTDPRKFQKRALALLIEHLEAADVNWKRRVLPQVYDIDADLQTVLELGFERVALTLYRVPLLDDAQILRAVRSRREIVAVIMNEQRFNQALVCDLNGLGVRTYVHTINGYRTITRYRRQGVWGAYTDFDCRQPLAAPHGRMDRVLQKARIWIESPSGSSRCQPEEACPDQPAWVRASVGKMRVAGKNLECIRVHPPHPSGSMSISLPSIAPGAALRIGLRDSSRQQGGAPVSISMKRASKAPLHHEISDQQSVVDLTAPEGEGDLTLTVSASDPSNRLLCLHLP